jgi:hypothetical protein
LDAGKNATGMGKGKRMTRPAKPNRANCPTCNGQGYVVYRYPSPKPDPAHWFTRGAHECDKCEEQEGEG